jgi:hypothetical protein
MESLKLRPSSGVQEGCSGSKVRHNMWETWSNTLN